MNNIETKELQTEIKSVNKTSKIVAISISKKKRNSKDECFFSTIDRKSRY